MGDSPRVLRAAGLTAAITGPLEDLGDVELPPLVADSTQGNAKNLDFFVKATDLIYEAVGRVADGKVLLVGGECSGTVGSLAGLGKVFPGKPGMLWLDSHGDFNTPESSPSGYIGGMCLAMACGRGPKLSNVIEAARPVLTEERLVHVGSRALDDPEVVAFNSSPAKLFTSQHVKSRGAGEVAPEAARHLANRSDWIVCHLDVDVVDPSIIPAVSYPAPGGLGLDEVAEFIKALQLTQKLKVVELAAYNPSLDRDGSSSRTILELLRQIYG